jgi:2,4-dienoyl-CoA reductase-like NADH-dependent reductase (Old Yellow Enzyme family)
MSDLFRPFKIKKLTLDNRFMRSATWDCTAAEDGSVTDRSLGIYREMGKTGVGLIVSGFAFVSWKGKVAKGQYGAHSDLMLSGLEKMAETAHARGAKIALQLVHSGIAAWETPAPAVSGISFVRREHYEMTEPEIESIIDDFAAAALRAKNAGFDAVQLHGAHGYLMSQFLTPRMNRRNDCWGGSIENRARFHIEVIKRIRRMTGGDYPLLIKFGIMDDLVDGLTLDDGLQIAKLMEGAGIDGIEVSAGNGSTAIPLSKAREPEDTVFRDRAAALKRAVGVPVMLVGGIRSLAKAEEIVSSGDADLISMCRPFICEPDLINRWRAGDSRPSECISCGRCMPDAKGIPALACHKHQKRGNSVA